MTRIWLIRHGEPVEEARGRCYGTFDFELSPAGREQMAQVAQYLRDEPIAAVYTSPLSRARESAQIIRPHAEVVTDLREIDFGELEGLPYDEIAVRYPDVYRQWMESPTEVQFPKGEAFEEMRERVLRAFDKIRSLPDGRTIAIVSHGGVNRILLAWALQIPDSCLFRLKQDYAAINLLAITDELPVVEMVNVTLPLPISYWNDYVIDRSEAIT